MEPLPELQTQSHRWEKNRPGHRIKVKKDVEIFVKEHGIKPALATILVGEHPPSKLYVKLKHWACKRVGIVSEDHKYPQEQNRKR